MQIIYNNVFYKYFNYKEYVLKNINIKFNSKDIVAIIGKSGSGKSTFIKHINGLLYPTKGEVFLDNVKINKKNILNIRRNIGYLIQNSEEQLFCETVIKEVMYGPINFGFSKTESEKKSKEILKLLGINKDFYYSYPLNLSGGQKQKVALASILSYDPKILILDEPTKSMDVEGINNFINLIKKIKQYKNIQLIFITHDMNLVYKLATRCVCFYKGEIIFDGKPNELFHNKKILSKNIIELPEIYKLEKLLLKNNILSKFYNFNFQLKDLINDVEIWRKNRGF